MHLFKHKFEGKGIDSQLPQAPEEAQEKASYFEKMKGVWEDAKGYLPDIPKPKIPEVIKKASETSWNFLKNVDWKRNVYSSGAGMAVRIGAKVFFETASFGAKTGVAAAAGGVAGGVKNWFNQRKELNEKANKEVGDIVENVIAGEYDRAISAGREVRQFPQFFIELADKKKRGEKLSIKDFKKYLKEDPHNALHIVDNEAEKLRQTILDKIKTLKINNRELGWSILKGAAAAAIGSMAIGELIDIWEASGSTWHFPNAKEFLTFVKKGFPSGAAQEIAQHVETGATYVGGASAAFKEAIKEKLYSFHSDTDDIESLTVAAAKIANDYLMNEQKLGLNLAELSDGQKVYVEDYLMKAMQGLSYKAGKEIVGIKGSLIAEAVEHARGLSDAQINNLDTTEAVKLSAVRRAFMHSKTYAMASNAVRFVGEKLGGPQITGSLIMAQ